MACVSVSLSEAECECDGASVTHCVCPQVQKEVGMAMLLVAWSLTEIIRYSYYMCALVNTIPYPLLWCR